MFQFNNKSWLVSFGAFGNGKGVAEFKVEKPVRDFQNIKFKTLNVKCKNKGSQLNCIHR
jgi:hypothetical protein